MKTTASQGQLADGLDVADLTIDGRHGTVPVRRYMPTAPAAPQGASPFVWLHGGGFAFGHLDMPEAHAVACAIARSGRTVHSVDYRRVPMWNIFRSPHPGILKGTRYPVPLEDVIDAFTYVLDASTVPVVLGGASAGACLAAAAAVRLRDENRPGPRGLVLAYGTFHGVLPALGPDVVMAKRGRGMGAKDANRMSWNYAGSLEALKDPHALPGGHDLRDLPTTLSIIAETDTLRASSGAFAEELAKAGVSVDHYVEPGSQHGFLNKPGTAPFEDAVARMNTWLNELDAKG